jgi:hypothetical protein
VICNLIEAGFQENQALGRIRKSFTMVENKWDIPLHGVVNEHGWFTFVG